MRNLLLGALLLLTACDLLVTRPEAEIDTAADWPPVCIQALDSAKVVDDIVCEEEKVE
jgi:hypothetical protein